MSQGTAAAGEGGTHVQVLLGAYILGGLSAAENTAVREHLDRCAPCQAEHDELAHVTGWLDLLAGSDAAGDPELAADPADEGGPAGN
jgi:anti-sigma factor RsiW